MSATLGRWVDGGNINVADVRITDGLHTSPTDPEHTILDKRGLFVIHAVMLHTGKVLWFCGHVEDGHYALKSYLFDFNHQSAPLASQDFPMHNPALARGGVRADNLPNNPVTGHFHADLFCCHFVHTADGKVLVVGGSDPEYRTPSPGDTHGSVGERYIYIFDPNTERWSAAMNGARPSRLTQGRWYPTAVMLGDGRIAVFSGRREYGSQPTDFTNPANIRAGTADWVEILTPPTYDSTRLTGAEMRLPIYPGLHLAPNGRIYYTHTTWGLEFDPPSETISLEIPNHATSASWTTHAGVRPPPATAAAPPRREEGMSVLLPPAQDGKILLVGGSEAIGTNSVGATVRVRNGGSTFTHIANAADPKSTAILNTSGANPVWSAGPTLAHGRINPHAVILPDKKVLIAGGHNSHKWNAVFPGNPPAPAHANNAQSLACELYDPATNSVATVAELNHARMYHSAAVLLPDGSVLIAGGADADPNKTSRFDENEFSLHVLAPDNFAYPGYPPNPVGVDPDRWMGPRIGFEDPIRPGIFFGVPFNRKDYEIYRPPYFFTAGTRPRIESVKKSGANTTRANYGDTLRIRSSLAGAGTEVALIRPGAATHHTDTEQRYVALTPTINGNDLDVTIPNDRNLIPPGYYMLWIVKAGKPCEKAKFVLVGSVLTPPPATTSGTGDSWCVVVTAATGSRDAPEVVFLQDLRRTLIQSGECGRWFIHAVNRIYYSGAPAVAEQMHRYIGLRRAMRAVLVKPAVGLIAAAKRAAGYEGGKSGRLRLIAMLAAMGLLGLGLLPAIALLVACKWALGTIVTKRESCDE